MNEAKREITAANSTPPGFRTRRAIALVPDGVRPDRSDALRNLAWQAGKRKLPPRPPRQRPRRVQAGDRARESLRREAALARGFRNNDFRFLLGASSSPPPCA